MKQSTTTDELEELPAVESEEMGQDALIPFGALSPAERMARLLGTGDDDEAVGDGLFWGDNYE